MSREDGYISSLFSLSERALPPQIDNPLARVLHRYSEPSCAPSLLHLLTAQPHAIERHIYVMHIVIRIDTFTDIRPRVTASSPARLYLKVATFIIIVTIYNRYCYEMPVCDHRLSRVTIFQEST